MTKQEFKYIYDKYFDSIRNYIYYRSGDVDLATDITQETFIKVWEKQFDNSKGLLKSLLYKIAADIFKDHLRHNKIIQESAFELKRLYTSTADDIDETNKLKQKYEIALAKLPEKQRVVFLMNKLDGLTYKEIAQDLSLSLKAIEKRMGQALKMLRNELQR